MTIKSPFDNYTLQARLLPMFILFVPVGLIMLAWYPATTIWMGTLETLGIPIIITALLSQLGRDLGKKKEPTLFSKWGGMPTDRILSIKSTFLDQSTLTRYRAKLIALILEVRFLDEKQEIADSVLAIGIFKTCTNFLREKTRDPNRFPLIFAENINYGFRRNLWAMKPAGIFISILGIIGSVLPFFITPTNINYPVLFITIFLNVCIFVLWIIRINPEWVKTPAEEYARQLFAACENL